MELICEAADLESYLRELEDVDYSHQVLREKVRQLREEAGERELDYIKVAYKFVRDEVSHSMDIESRKVTCGASEVLSYGEGICYAKSHLLAALLRGRGIPAGFCYQRLLLGETVEEGYCLHGLNAVYVVGEGRWLRLDARGNKPGVQAEFRLDGEQLAFPIREELGEVDYVVIYAEPHPSVLGVLKEQTNCREMCQYYLPSAL